MARAGYGHSLHNQHSERRKMKKAKASKADLQIAMQLSSALDALADRLDATFPEAIDRRGDEDCAETFDKDDPEHCTRALNYLLDLARRASLGRVVWGCAVMLDPHNRMVDPKADTIEHHPHAALGLAAHDAQPRSEWSEDIGPVLWWSFPIDEPPYCGTPLDSDWPDYHTHWTYAISPNQPTAIEELNRG
jgi:hypothetical protein